jgi:glycerophosphoryl diester phosphodiesterase
MNVLSDPAARLVIAHRGTSAHFPENTAASFDHALSLGVDAIEFDLRISRDGHVVVIHDPTVDRTTDGTGAVAELTLAELKALDAGARFTRNGRSFPWRGQGLRILTFDELLDRYPSIPLLIEVKVATAADGARQAIESHNSVGRVLMDSTAIDAVTPFRGTPLLSGACFDDVLHLLPHVITGHAPATLPYSALCIPRWYKGLPIPVRRLAKLARSRGVSTHVWTVNDPNVARSLWAGGINGIITDDPETMLAVRRTLRD